MTWVTAAVMRALVLTLFWIALAGWSADYAVYGVTSVVLATAMSLALLPPHPPSPRTWLRRAVGTLTLLGWFLWQSARGGVDVALRALKPTVDADPQVVVAPLEIPPGAARQVALILMNLMPGSMVQRVITEDGEPAHAPGHSPTHVELHTLSLDLEPAEQWRQLQHRTRKAVDPDPAL